MEDGSLGAIKQLRGQNLTHKNNGEARNPRRFLKKYLIFFYNFIFKPGTQVPGGFPASSRLLHY